MDAKAEKLYAVILRAANYFLHNCKTYPIEILIEDDPSYEEVAGLAEGLRKILHALMDDLDPQLTQQAYDYCSLMSQMANAINTKDESALTALVTILEKKPFALQ